MQTSRRHNRPCMTSHNTDLRTTSQFVEGSLESALSLNSSSLLDSPGLYWQHQFVDTCSMWTLRCCTEHANLDQPNGVIEKRGQLAKGEEELLPARMELNHAGVGTTAYICGPSKKSSHGNTAYRTEISSYTGSQIPQCQAEGCKANLSSAKHYHRRHKVCELHSKAPTVVVGRLIQRFCQQCSRFHPTSEFDEGKRSCRKRLADHNRRRRKPKRSQRTASQCKSGARDLEDDNNKTKRLSGHDATGIQMIPNMVPITRTPPRFNSVTFLSSGTMMTFPNTLSSSGTMMTYSCATRNI